MLVLTRRLNQRIRIGKDIELVIIELKSDLVKIGIHAPREVAIYRGEVYEAIAQANRSAALTNESAETLKILQELYRKD